MDRLRTTGFSHLLEGQSGFVSILVTEIIIHPEIRLSPQLISGLTVWDALDDATLWHKHRTSTLTNNIQTQEIHQWENQKLLASHLPNSFLSYIQNQIKNSTQTCNTGSEMSVFVHSDNTSVRFTINKPGLLGCLISLVV